MFPWQRQRHVKLQDKESDQDHVPELQDALVGLPLAGSNWESCKGLLTNVHLVLTANFIQSAMIQIYKLIHAQ